VKLRPWYKIMSTKEMSFSQVKRRILDTPSRHSINQGIPAGEQRKRNYREIMHISV
jgi:hypothetical protein